MLLPERRPETWVGRALRWGLAGAIAGATLLAVGGRAESAVGGRADGPLVGPRSVEAPTGDPAMIVPQLRRSIPLQQSAIEQLSGRQTTETIDAAAQTIMRAYLLVRAAHDGILNKMTRQRVAGGRESVDPTLEWKARGLNEARRRIVTAHDGLRGVRPDESDQIERRIQLLSGAIRQIERVLVTLP